MVKYKTLLVIGAGASAEANLPDGAKLKHAISELLNLSFNGIGTATGDKLIFESVAGHARTHTKSDLGPYLDAATSIRDGMPLARSIDSYIDHHHENSFIKLCGKLAIVRSILNAESNSWLYANPTNFKNKPDFLSLSQTWFTTFFQILTENCRAPELKDRLSSIALVIFNYDRCFEQFLYHSLINYYKISENEAADLVNGMEIYHPYGTVGFLPWQKKTPTVPYGANISAADLLKVSERILTFTEGTDAKESEIVAIRERVQESNLFVFLGFAFHRLNMELLFAQPCKADYARHCYATAYNFSDSDKQVVCRKLSGVIGIPSERINIRNDLKCNDFLEAYYRSLSLE